MTDSTDPTALMGLIAMFGGVGLIAALSLIAMQEWKEDRLARRNAASYQGYIAQPLISGSTLLRAAVFLLTLCIGWVAGPRVQAYRSQGATQAAEAEKDLIEAERKLNRKKMDDTEPPSVCVHSSLSAILAGSTDSTTFDGPHRDSEPRPYSPPR